MKSSETIVEGVIITQPVFVSKYTKNNKTYGTFDLDVSIYNQRDSKINIMSIRTQFDIQKWNPLQYKQRIKMSVLKNKDNTYKRLVSKKDNKVRYICNIVERRDYETTL